MIGIEKMASIGRRYAPSNAWVGENNPIAKRKNAIFSKAHSKNDDISLASASEKFGR